MIKKIFLGVFSITAISSIAIAGFSNLSGLNSSIISTNDSSHSFSNKETQVVEVSDIDDIKSALDDSQTDNVFSIKLVSDINLMSYNPTEQYLNNTSYNFSYFEIDGNGYSFENKNEDNFFKPLFSEINLSGDSNNEFATFYVHDLVFDNVGFIFDQINYSVNYDNSDYNSSSKIGQNSLSFQNIEFKNINLNTDYTLSNEGEMTEKPVKNYGLLFNNLNLTTSFSGDSNSQVISNSGVYFNNIFIDSNSINTSVYSDSVLDANNPFVNLHELLFSPLGTISILNLDKNYNFSGEIVNFSNIYISENDFNFKFYLNQKYLDPSDPSYGISSLYNLGVSSLFNIIILNNSKKEADIEIGFKDIVLQKNNFKFQTKNHFNNYNLGYLNNSTESYSSNFEVSSLENIFIYENNLDYMGDTPNLKSKSNLDAPSQKDVYVLRTYLFASDVSTNLPSILNNVLIVNDSLRDDKIFLSYDQSSNDNKISTFSQISEQQIFNVEKTLQSENINYIKNINSNGDFDGFLIGTTSEQLIFHNLSIYGRKQWGKRNIKTIQFNYYLFNNINKNVLSIDELKIFDESGNEYYSGSNYENGFAELKLKKTTQEKLSNSSIEITYSIYDYQNDITTNNNSIYIYSDQLKDTITPALSSDSFIFWTSTAAIFMYIIIFLIILISIILIYLHFANKSKATKIKAPKTKKVKQTKTKVKPTSKSSSKKPNKVASSKKTKKQNSKPLKNNTSPKQQNYANEYQNIESEYFDNYQDLNYNDIYNEYYKDFDDNIEENLLGSNDNLNKNTKKSSKSKKQAKLKKSKSKPNNLDDFKFYNDKDNKIQEEIEDLLKEQTFN